MFTYQYPYTDFHELNLDWFLSEFTRIQKYAETTMQSSMEQYISEHFSDIATKVMYNESERNMTFVMVNNNG